MGGATANALIGVCLCVFACSVESQDKKADLHKHKITALELQVSRLTGMLQASHDKNKAHELLVMDHMQSKKKLETDLTKAKREEMEMRRDRFKLEKEKEHAALSSSAWYQKFMESQETIKLRVCVQ